MNLKETNTTLALVQAFDRRTVGEVDVRAWHSVLGDLDVADVLEAVRRHYADSSDWMMPVHVRRLVAGIVADRSRPEVSPWAPGQYGVRREDAVPEVTGPVDESALTASVRSLLESVRAMLPEGSREALAPRRVAWEREHKAFLRTRDGVPNPLYKANPGGLGTRCLKAELHGPHEWKIDGDGFRCPGTVPDFDADDVHPADAHRCEYCTFVTASAERMDGHERATGHRASR